MTTISLAVSKLVHSPRNVRQPSPDDDTTDLEESILEFGLLNPLTAHPMPRSKHGVFAGGRRLLALQRLIERKQLPKDHAVDVTVRDESDITLTEMSFAENAVRLALPAVTEFQTYSRLIDEGADITAVAHRYQVTELHVRQRMRLGKLHPEILEALAGDRLTLDIAKAYAATEDQELQKRIFDQRPTHPYEIRAAMKRDLVNAGVDRMLALVGMDAYAAAGGRAEEDLFTPGEARVLDVEILRGLYDAKLIAQRDLLSLPASVTLQFGGEGLGARVDIVDEPTDEQRERQIAIDAELETLERQLERIAEFDQDAPFPRWVAIGGGDQDEVNRIVHQRRTLMSEVEAIAATFDWPAGPLIAAASAADGRLVVSSFHRPLGWKPDAVTTSLPSDPAPPRAAAPAAKKGGLESSPAAKTSPEPTAAPQKPVINGFRPDRHTSTGLYRQPEDIAREQYGLTKDAVEAMRSHQRQTLQAAMLSTPIAEKLAHTFLIFVLARDMLRERHADDYRLDPDGKLGVGRVPSREHDPHQVRADLAAQPAASIVGDALGRLQASDWMREPDVDTAFRRFSTSPYIDQQRAAACVAAAMLNRSLGIPGFRVPVHDTIAEFLTVERDIRDYWTPDAAYFARLPKNQKLEAVRFVDAAVAKRIANLGTDDLTEAAAMIMSGTLTAASKYGLSREACDRAAGWVPAYLSFAQPEDDDPEDPDDDDGLSDEALGEPVPNPNGVYEATETLECAAAKGERIVAEIDLLEMADGWRAVCSYSLGNGSGRGSPLTKGDDVHPTREAAVAAAAADLAAGMRKQDHADARHVLKWVAEISPAAISSVTPLTRANYSDELRRAVGAIIADRAQITPGIVERELPERWKSQMPSRVTIARAITALGWHKIQRPGSGVCYARPAQVAA